MQSISPVKQDILFMLEQLPENYLHRVSQFMRFLLFGRQAKQQQTAFLSKLTKIHQNLQQSGYRFRSKAEIDADIQIERDSWE